MTRRVPPRLRRDAAAAARPPGAARAARRARRLPDLPRLPRARGRRDRRGGLGARRDRPRASPARPRRSSAATPRSSSPTASPTPASAPGWQAHAAAVSEIVDFRSMLPRRAGAAPDPWSRSRRSTAGYPLRRRGRLAGGGSLADALATARRAARPRRRDARWSTASASHPARLVRLGTRDFRLADTLIAEPDAPAAGFALGPRVIVLAAPISPPAASSAEGAMFDSSYRLRLAPGRRPRRRCAPTRVARFGDSGLQWRDRRDGPPGRRPLRRPARARSWCWSASPGSRSAASASPRRCAPTSRQDRDHRHAEDPRRHRRHDLRGLPDRDRPARARSASPLGLVARRRAAAARGALRRRAPAGAGGLRPLSAAARRGGALRRADRAPLHRLAARPAPATSAPPSSTAT